MAGQRWFKTRETGRRHVESHPLRLEGYIEKTWVLNDFELVE